MKIYLQMEGDKLVQLVPLDQYNAIKRELETRLERTKKAADLRIERQRKALAALNREIRSSQKRERDAAGELTNMRIYEGIVQSVRTILKADREEKTEDAAKRVMALSKLAEPPKVDGKTPEEIMQSVYYSTPAAEYPFRKAASAVLAAFGNQSRSAEIPWIEWHGGECPLKDEDVEEWEYKQTDGTLIAHPCASPSLYAWEVPESAIAAYRVIKWREGCGPVDWKAKLERWEELEQWKERAEKAESELARVIKAAHEAGWNGVENSKDLAQFIKDQAEEVGNRQASLLAACTNIDELKSRADRWYNQAKSENEKYLKAVEQIAHLQRTHFSQLRPISEAGPVPEGCVRVSGWLEDEKWIISSALWSTDTHFADIQLPAAKSDDSAKPEPETFEAHGKVWTRHTPGDAMPVDTVTLIDVLMDDDIICLEQYVEFASTWSSIIGWRYADAHLVTPNATECGQCADKSNFQLAPGEG